MKNKIKRAFVWCVILQSLPIATMLIIGNLRYDNMSIMGFLWGIDIWILCIVIYLLDHRQRVRDKKQSDFGASQMK